MIRSMPSNAASAMAQFTQADFALNALNFPQAYRQLSLRFGSWMAFDLLKTQKEIHRADQQTERFVSQLLDQQIVSRVVGAY